MLDSFEDTRLLVKNQALRDLYNYSQQDINEEYKGLSDAQKARVHYCDSIIATVLLGCPRYLFGRASDSLDQILVILSYGNGVIDNLLLPALQESFPSANFHLRSLTWPLRLKGDNP